jgi:AIR synthase-related protein
VSLVELVQSLRAAKGIRFKRDIQAVAAKLFDPAATIRNGDDAAAIPDGAGYTLLAAEGMLPGFVAQDPWFAGYCAVMVNVSDILAMGGRPLAVVDVLFAGEGACGEQVLDGMQAAARAFGVPVVGGHTSRLAGPDSYLAAAIVGRGQTLITSFDAQPGDVLVAVCDLRGSYRGDAPYFDAATQRAPELLRALLPLLPELAEAGLVRAGKDVSMAGIVGTLTMLCEGSGVGARLALDALPRPDDVSLLRWLGTFPSFGFLLAVAPAHVAEVHRRFQTAGVASASVGAFQAPPRVELEWGQERAVFWDLAQEPLTGFGAQLRQAAS